MSDQNQLSDVDLVTLDYDGKVKPKAQAVRPAFNSVYEFTIRRRLGGLPAEFNTLDLMGPSIDRMITDTASEIVEMIPGEADRLRKDGHVKVAEILEELSEVLSGC